MSLATSILNCPSGQTYVRVVRQSGSSHANEETYKILSGSTVLVEGAAIGANQRVENEYCLASSTTGQYELRLEDSLNDAWYDGSWIALYGKNGNLVFKGTMAEQSVESIPISLYSPINTGSEWQFSSTYTAGWDELNFSASGWTTVDMSSITTTARGTQYFRKVFTGMPNMAAIEAQFKYTQGIIAYLNGIEIFRDHMPAGDVDSKTLAVGQHETREFHGVIRPADVAEDSRCVLAVELHFTSADHTAAINFDAFLSYHAGRGNDKCYPLHLEYTVTADAAVTDAQNPFTWSTAAYATIHHSDLPTSIYATVVGNVIPVVNGLRLWPNRGGYENYMPSEVALFGGDSADTTSWNHVVSASNIVYTAGQYYRAFNDLNEQMFKSYKLTINAAKVENIRLYNTNFLVCNHPANHIVYEASKYEFYTYYSSVSVNPVIPVSGECSISPELPTGVILNTANCAISGVATEHSPAKTYTITAMIPTTGVPAQGVISLAFLPCAGTMLHIRRTSGALGEFEGYTIVDNDSRDVILSVAEEASNTEYHHYVCMTTTSYAVSVFGNNRAFWNQNSHLYLYNVLPEGEELILRIRFDEYEAFTHHVELRNYNIPAASEWYYKMGSVPSNWYNDDVSGWSQGHIYTFPETSNIQLYKKTFNLARLEDVSNYVLSIRYKYGCIVYMNGYEIWRNGVSGTLSTSSVSNQEYAEVMYRVALLPSRGVTAATNTQYYARIGSNTIAIALVNPAGVTKSFFDATVRMTSPAMESHLWEIETSSTGTSSKDAVFDEYYISALSTITCTDISLTVTFKNDRREWINAFGVRNNYAQNSMTIRNIKLWGRNGANSAWTELKSATSMSWTEKNQVLVLHFMNSVAYNQYRFTDINNNNCRWRIQGLYLINDNVLSDGTPLEYPAEISIYRDVKMTPVYPEGDNLLSLSIKPSLPKGLSFDALTGAITGTPTVESNSMYTVTATNAIGQTQTSSFRLKVVICTGDRNMVTMRIRADGYSDENSYKLHRGRGRTGVILAELNPFTIANNVIYADFCMPNGIYTFEGIDNRGDGWENNSGWMVNVDANTFTTDVVQVGIGAAPVSATTVFSTYLPFQADLSTWKVYQNSLSGSSWMQVSFDDSKWSNYVDSKIPASSRVTTYIRKTFTIDNVHDYTLLNVRVVYRGGVVAYFNGKRVARFNLVENYNANTVSTVRDTKDQEGRFAILMDLDNAVTGTNVIAFEHHRNKNDANTVVPKFRATGVFGVEDISAIPTIVSFLNTTTHSTPKKIFELDPNTFETLMKVEGWFVEWTVANLEGLRFNRFAAVTNNDVKGIGFQIGGSMKSIYDESARALLYKSGASGINLKQSTRSWLTMNAVATTPYLNYVLNITRSTKNSFEVNGFFFGYEKAASFYCTKSGNFLRVLGGQTSTAPCGEGMTGYQYRVCEASSSSTTSQYGVFGEAHTEHCQYLPPANVKYGTSNKFVFGQMEESTTPVPSYTNIVTNWAARNLPEGLEIDTAT